MTVSHDHKLDMPGEARVSSVPSFIAGTVAGVSEAFFIHPIDTYKVCWYPLTSADTSESSWRVTFFWGDRASIEEIENLAPYYLIVF